MVIGVIAQFAAVVGDKNGLPGLESGFIGQANDQRAHANRCRSHAGSTVVIEPEVL